MGFFKSEITGFNEYSILRARQKYNKDYLVSTQYSTNSWNIIRIWFTIHDRIYTSEKITGVGEWVKQDRCIPLALMHVFFSGL